MATDPIEPPPGALVVIEHASDPRTALAPAIPEAARGELAVRLYLSTLAEGPSRVSMRSGLNVIARLLDASLPANEEVWPRVPWHRLRVEHTLAIRAKLLSQYAPRSVNRMLAALAGTLHAAWQQGFIAAEDYQRAVDFKRARVSRVPVGRAITPAEMDKLVEAAREPPGLAGYRDAALVATMYGSGLRREEAATLDRLAYDAKTGEIRVTGKGNKLRTTFLASEWARYLDEWLCHRGDHPGPLFPRLHKTGGLTRHALSVSAVNRLLKRLEEATGVAHFTPHDTRRSFATGLLDAGVDLVTVKELMGHESVDTTAIYDRRGERVKKEAVERLNRKPTARRPK